MESLVVDSLLVSLVAAIDLQIMESSTRLKIFAAAGSTYGSKYSLMVMIGSPKKGACKVLPSGRRRVDVCRRLQAASRVDYHNLEATHSRKQEESNTKERK